MGIKINLKDTPDSQNFGPLPIGKYPCRLNIHAYQKDAQGNFMLDGDQQKCYWRSTNGDPQWKFTAVVLDGPYKGKEMHDQFTFSSGGLKRLKVVIVRAGLATGDENEFNIEPEDLDGTFWNIEIDKHEPSTKLNPKTGQPYINARIAFAGFELMDAETAARLAKGAPVATGNGAGPTADDEDKPPF